jgi:hypothetical protein
VGCSCCRCRLAMRTCRSAGSCTRTCGVGDATETTHALSALAFTHQVDELFAVVGTGNIRAEGAVRRNEMEWVGVTDKYFGMTLHVYRLRPADLDQSAQQNGLPGGPAHEPAWGKNQ